MGRGTDVTVQPSFSIRTLLQQVWVAKPGGARGILFLALKGSVDIPLLAEGRLPPYDSACRCSVCLPP